MALMSFQRLDLCFAGDPSVLPWAGMNDPVGVSIINP